MLLEGSLLDAFTDSCSGKVRSCFLLLIAQRYVGFPCADDNKIILLVIIVIMITTMIY